MIDLQPVPIPKEEWLKEIKWLAEQASQTTIACLPQCKEHTRIMEAGRTQEPSH